METKHPHAVRHIEGTGVHPVIRLYYEFNHLKALYRQGWLHAGVPREQCETVAEHSLGVALLVLMLADQASPGIDTPKAVIMGLLHDFGEIYAGDIVPGGMAPEEKHHLERSAVHRIFGPLPDGDRYLAIWEEYEDGASPEARFVREIDRLEMGLQASVYEHEGFGPLPGFFQSTDQALSTPGLRGILGELLAMRTSHM